MAANAARCLPAGIPAVAVRWRPQVAAPTVSPCSARRGILGRNPIVDPGVLQAVRRLIRLNPDPHVSAEASETTTKRGGCGLSVGRQGELHGGLLARTDPVHTCNTAELREHLVQVLIAHSIGTWHKEKPGMWVVVPFLVQLVSFPTLLVHETQLVDAVEHRGDVLVQLGGADLVYLHEDLELVGIHDVSGHEVVEVSTE
eukprot:CAMPEP_0117620238 /NCGR_PEP_ID=MMETSP0784-20121206/87027_1 /TAXON_ID=39447 /ORGANISM="" /LENGTH=199 /DNA_ID=CAMNT_0005424149 /DNA_START=197 /DNA_END=796 /DNA_ORIENTATION=+